MAKLSAKDRAAHALANKKIAEKKLDNIMLTFWANQYRYWLMKDLTKGEKK